MKRARYLGPSGCRVELVEWVDSNSRAGWHSLAEAQSEAQGTMLCATVGYLVHETPDLVLLASSTCQHRPPQKDDVNLTMEIPKAAILRRSRLKGPK